MHKCAENISNAIKHIADAHKKPNRKCIYLLLSFGICIHLIKYITHASIKQYAHNHIHMYTCTEVLALQCIRLRFECATTAQFTSDVNFWHVYI